PRLPGAWSDLRCKVQVGEALLDVVITHEDVTLTVLEGRGRVTVQIGAHTFTLDQAAGSLSVRYEHVDG
ncbi:MAG: glycosyl hydrolase family 65 protein, partial [Bacillota bacterium]|nr:glycosyl hydrolase family 65 protein [Bacillota bacterium]